MNIKFAQRIENTPKSFIREILKVTTNPEIISFVGGLPNPFLFPIEPCKEATKKVLEESGREALQYSTTEGGMFIWVKLPRGISAIELFDVTIKDNIAFVPGDPFYVDPQDVNTLRLNYTNADEDTIREGIKRLGKRIKSIIPGGREWGP